MIHRRYTAVSAPFGTLYLTVADNRLIRIEPQKPTVADALRFDNHPILIAAASALNAYFTGRSPTPSLPCREAFSPFQQAVFHAVRAIPYGEARSLDSIAKTIGRPDAAHAIDMLCQSNPLWIAVPTHRVLTSDTAKAPHLTASEILRRMERRYRHDRLTKHEKEGKLFVINPM